jgi:Helix-turn-helix domain
MGELRMSVNERIRLEAFGRVKRKEITVVAAAELMGLSLRQARRMWKRFKANGDEGLVHRLRGRASNRRLSAEVADRVVKLHQERYADFGPTFACEKLAVDGLTLSPETLTALLKVRGLWQRRRRRGRHRKRRERRSCLGSMVQMDGSHHDWFEGRSGKCVLMVMIDDASSQTSARFYPAETTDAAFDVVGRWVKKRGLPRALYVDGHSIYRDEDHPDHPTQFGRACKQLGVELIRAHSPQAKGRVERRNAVFQDRLVKELRLRGISDMAHANVFLDCKFLDELNGKYAIKPKREQDLHRLLEANVSLEEILCPQEHRVVGNDWCVRWRSRWLQIDKQHGGLNLARRKVLIKHPADGKLIVEHNGQRLTVHELNAKPSTPKIRKPIVNNRKWKPKADHPWNKPEPGRNLAPRAEPAPATPARVPLVGKPKAG